MAQKITEIGIGSQVVRNDFDNLPIYKEMKRVTDDFGNVFVRIPKFYIKKTSTAGKLAVQISKSQIQGSYLPKCFWDFTKNKELPYVDVGAYLASSSGGKLASKAGVKPLVTTSIGGFRTLAQANGSGYQQMDIHVVDMLQCLFYVEFATLNSQSIHPGLTGGPESGTTGTTDAVAASSGAMGTGATHQFMYRGIEDLWGNVYQWVDGVNFNDRQAWVCENADNYASDIFASPYQKLSYVNADSDGYVKEIGFDPNRPYAEFPVVTSGANSTTYYSDNYYQAAGQRVARFGGHFPAGASAGVSLWDLSHASTMTASSSGGRLVRKAL